MRLLTNIDAVVVATVALIPIFAASLMADGVNSALVSLLRGAGKQKVGGGAGGSGSTRRWRR